MSRRKRPLQIVVEAGKPIAVILDINEYEKMLQRLAEFDDVATLQEMRNRPLSFRPLDEFLGERKVSSF